MIATILLAFLFIITLPGCGSIKSPTEPVKQAESKQLLTGSQTTIPPAAEENVWYAERTYQLSSDKEWPIDINGVVSFSTCGTNIIPTRKGAKTWTISLLVTHLGVNIDPNFPDGALYFTFGPTGTAFVNPATVQLKWVKLFGSSEVNSNLNLYLWDTATFSWIKKSNSNDVGENLPQWDKLLGKVTFGVPHFSLWAISQD